MEFMFLLVLLVNCAAFRDVNISPQTLDIRTQTTYRFAFKTVSEIDSGGRLEITFPGIFSNLEDRNVGCESNLKENCIPNCYFSGQNLLVEGCFPQTSNTFYIDAFEINNPDYSGTSDSFVVKSFSSDGSQLESKASGLQKTYSPIAMIATPGIQSSSDIAGEVSTWKISFQSDYQIPAGGFISLEFPDWTALETSYCGETQTCSGVRNLEVLSNCQCVSNELRLSLSQEAQGSLEFSVEGIKNPPSTATYTGFVLKTGLGTGVLQEAQSISFKVNKPSTINLSRFVVKSSEIVYSKSNYEFEISCQLPVHTQAILELTFPENEFTVDPNFTTEIQGIFGIRPNPQFSVSDSVISISEGFNSDLESMEYINFVVKQIQNPPTTKPTDYIKILIKDSNGEICQTQEDNLLSFTASPSTLVNTKVAVQDLTINAKTIYTFSFESSVTIPSGGSIKITLPQQISAENHPQKECFFIPDSSMLKSTSLCEVTDNKYIWVTNGFSESYTSGNIELQVKDITNPETPEPSNPILIQTFPDSSFNYQIAKDETLLIEAQPATLQSMEVTPNTLVTGEVSSYRFTITTSQPIPLKGSVFVKLPEEIQLLVLENNCFNPIGYETGFECENTLNSITVLKGFEESRFEPGVLSFTIEGIRNPPTTKPSSSFEVETRSGKYSIESKSSGITLTMQDPHELNECFIEISNSNVAQKADYTFSFKPYNLFYDGGSVEIIPPEEVIIPDLPECNTDSIQIRSISCSKENQKLIVSISLTKDTATAQLSFKVKNIQNPSSTKPSGSFKFYTKTESYFIDSKTSDLRVTASTPASLEVVNATSQSQGISETTKYLFTVKPSLLIPKNGYIQVKFPEQITILENYSCKQEDYVVCTNTGDNRISVYLFSDEDFYPAQVSFSILNLQNYNKVGSSSGFEITTNTQDGYPIEADNSKVVEFVCYSPCATCENTPSNCLSCISDSQKPYYWEGECHETCKEGFIDLDNSKTCVECHLSCKACETTTQTCTSCTRNGEFPYLHGTECKSECPPNTYISSNFSCLACSDSCVTCETEATKCTSCPAEQYLYNHQCVDSCEQGTTIIQNKECFDCNSSCKKCENSVNKCTECEEGMFLHNYSCVETCEEEVTITEGSTCLDCKSPCKTCSGSVNSCTSCVSGYSLHKGSCLASCPEAFTSVEGVCEECSAECLACQGEVNYCTECEDPKYKYKGRCINSCPEGETVPVESECVSCVDGCETCYETADNCGSCQDGYVLNNGSCIKNCPENKVQVNKECRDCDPICDACVGTPFNCTACAGDLLQYQNQCLLSCPANVTVEIGQECLSCEYPCITCKDQTSYCLTCEEELLQFQGNCLSSCPSSYEEYQGTCVPKQLAEGECAKGCTIEKRQNDICDPECNVRACNFDEELCLEYLGERSITYSERLPVEESPFPFSSIGLCGLGVVGVSKLMSGATLHIAGSVGVLGFLEATSWLVLLGFLGSADTVKGRELLEEQGQITLSVVVVVSVIVFNFSVNFLFVYLFYKRVLRDDDILRIWTNTYKKTTRCVVLVCLFWSFLFIRIIYSRIFRLNKFSAQLDRKVHLFKPLVYITYLWLGLVSIPMICILVYVLSCFSTGNIVFLVALDAFIVTCLTTLVVVADLVLMNNDIKKESEQFRPKKTLVTVETDNLQVENFRIFQGLKNNFDFQLENFKVCSIPENTLTERSLLESTNKTSQAPEPESELVSKSQEKEFTLMPENIAPDLESSYEFIDESNEPQLLETISEESYLELSEAEVDEFDPECVRVMHRPSGRKILVKKSFEDSDGEKLNSSMYEILEIESDVHYGVLKKHNSEKVLRARRSFQGARIMDVQMKLCDKWMVGRLVENEEDFDFENAVLDSRDPECVMVLHKVTGNYLRVKKTFQGSRKIDPFSGKSSSELFGSYSSLKVSSSDLREAWVSSEGSKVKVRRNFLGGVVLDILNIEDLRSFMEQQQVTPNFNDESNEELFEGLFFEYSQETSQEALQEPTQESPEELTQDSPEEPTQDSPEEPTEEPTQDFPKESTQEPPEEPQQYLIFEKIDYSKESPSKSRRKKSKRSSKASTPRNYSQESFRSAEGIYLQRLRTPSPPKTRHKSKANQESFSKKTSILHLRNEASGMDIEVLRRRI